MSLKILKGTSMKIVHTVKISVILLLMATFSANAGLITLDATNRGWYDQNGNSNGDSAGNNYVAGDCGGTVCNGNTDDYRNWFVFDLAGISTATSAVLRLEVPGGNGFHSTNDAFEAYTLFDVDTNTANLGQGNDLSIWEDLGEGSIFGSYNVMDSDLGLFVEITLNSIGLATLNLNAGFNFALGGGITSLDAAANDEYAFGWTDANYLTQLVIETQEVSAPGGLTLILISLIGLITVRRASNK